jgi:error-prone DNA polymerase
MARQRPATANGMTFMLLEDEHGTINLIVAPPVYDRCRVPVRAEPLIGAEGRLEHREGTINVVVDRVWRLERPDLPKAEIRPLRGEPSGFTPRAEPRRIWSNDDSAENELRAVAPVAHSFGRRGR